MRNDASFNEVVALVLKRAESEGLLPWQRPTVDGVASIHGAPVNAVTGKGYQGLNRWILWWTGGHYFAGAGQWATAGATVADRGAAVRIWIPAKWRTLVDRDTGKVVGKVPFRFKVGIVYPVKAVTGWTAPAPAVTVDVPADEAADAIVKAMPNAPTLRETTVESGSYSPALDVVTMPSRNLCRSTARYYKTLFHELAHSTGHESRIGREMGGFSGSHAYSREELVAEFSAAMLVDSCGMTAETLDNSAAYVKHWIEFIAKDPTVLADAAADAEKAVAYIRGERVTRKGKREEGKAA